MIEGPRSVAHPHSPRSGLFPVLPVKDRHAGRLQTDLTIHKTDRNVQPLSDDLVRGFHLLLPVGGSVETSHDDTGDLSQLPRARRTDAHEAHAPAEHGRRSPTSQLALPDRRDDLGLELSGRTTDAGGGFWPCHRHHCGHPCRAAALIADVRQTRSGQTDHYRAPDAKPTCSTTAWIPCLPECRIAPLAVRAEYPVAPGKEASRKRTYRPALGVAEDAPSCHSTSVRSRDAVDLYPAARSRCFAVY